VTQGPLGPLSVLLLLLLCFYVFVNFQKNAIPFELLIHLVYLTTCNIRDIRLCKQLPISKKNAIPFALLIQLNNHLEDTKVSTPFTESFAEKCVLREILFLITGLVAICI